MSGGGAGGAAGRPGAAGGGAGGDKRNAAVRWLEGVRSGEILSAPG